VEHGLAKLGERWETWGLWFQVVEKGSLDLVLAVSRWVWEGDDVE
jgi:hypothetical protein